MDNKELDTDIKISEYLKKNPTQRFKSYTILIVFVLIFLGIIFLSGKIGPDIFGLVLFFAIVSLPILIIFRFKLASILPSVMADNILEIDHDDSKKRELKIRFDIPLILKQIMTYIVIILLLIGSIVLLYVSNNELITKESVIYILGAFVTQAIAGVIIMNFDELVVGRTNVIDI